jgi:hypothetical protein
MIMLIIYNERIMIKQPINKKEFILCLFEIPLVDCLTLTAVFIIV